MRVLRVLAVAGMLLGVMSTSVDAANRRTVPSKIIAVDEVTSGDQVVQITGRVTSRRAECVSNRTLRAVVHNAGIFFGTGVTDANGFFAIDGTGPRDVLYKITLQRSRPAGFRCGGDVHVEELG